MARLNAETRDVFGKKLKNLRKEGKLPAVLYGRGTESAPLFVHLKEFKKAWKEAGESKIIELKKEESKTPVNVIIKDVRLDPLTSEPVHADFYKVEMDKPIIASISLVFEGTAPAVKELSGSLVKVLREIEVEALPKDMPSEIKVDISKLNTFEDKIAVSDLDMPKGVKATAKEDDIVVLVEEPRKEEEAAPERTLEDIEVEKKGKEEKEGKEEEEEKK